MRLVRSQRWPARDALRGWPHKARRPLTAWRRGARLSRAARRAIDEAETIGVSAVSAWELAMLVGRRRISLDRDVSAWVRQALAPARVRQHPLTADVAVAAGLLDGGGFPGDPADRFIYATAQAARARLVTRDEAIRGYDARTTVW